jgi:predicted nucleic acid-binding protein
MNFIDTNIFIRYLVKDDQDKAEACFRLLEKAKASKVELFTSESVIAEVVFVLSSKRLYNLSHQDIRVRLYPILSLPGLKMSNRRQYLRALDVYGNNNIDFEDALSIATMERKKISQIYSYAEDFDRVKDCEISRIEPE